MPFKFGFFLFYGPKTSRVFPHSASGPRPHFNPPRTISPQWPWRMHPNLALVCLCPQKAVWYPGLGIPQPPCSLTLGQWDRLVRPCPAMVSTWLPIPKGAAGPHSAMTIGHLNLIIMTAIIRTNKANSFYGDYLPQPAPMLGKNQ